MFWFIYRRVKHMQCVYCVGVKCNLRSLHLQLAVAYFGGSHFFIMLYSCSHSALPPQRLKTIVGQLSWAMCPTQEIWTREVGLVTWEGRRHHIIGSIYTLEGSKILPLLARLERQGLGLEARQHQDGAFDYFGCQPSCLIHVIFCHRCF